MATTIDGISTPAAAAAASPASAPAPSTAQVSAGALGGGFVPTALFELSMPLAGAGASGLRAPLNPEDAGALLLLAEATLDKTTAMTRAARLETRFGAAGGALAAVGLQLGETPATLKAKQDALDAAEGKLKTDTDQQTDLQKQYDDLGTTIGDLQGQIAAAGPDADTSQLRSELAAAELSRSQVQPRLAAADEAVAADTAAVASATATVEAAQANLENQLGKAAAALSQIATGLRSDIGRDAGQAVQTSARRDVAYDDVADTAKRFREDDVARSRRDDDAQGADHGQELAEQLAAALQAAVPVLQGFAAAPPPAVPRDVALEAGGRVRLSL